MRPKKAKVVMVDGKPTVYLRAGERGSFYVPGGVSIEMHPDDVEAAKGREYAAWKNRNRRIEAAETTAVEEALKSGVPLSDGATIRAVKRKAREAVLSDSR